MAVKTYRFYARGRNELFIRRGTVEVVLSTGAIQKTQEGIRYSFAPDGFLELREGQDLLADGPMDPETGAPALQDAVEWLRSQPAFNKRVWEEGNEPGRMLPTEADFIGQVTAAVAALDPEPVDALLLQEREGHGRSLLIKVAEDALVSIADTRAALARQEPDGGEGDGHPDLAPDAPGSVLEEALSGGDAEAALANVQAAVAATGEE